MKEMSMKNKMIAEICVEKGIEKIDISYNWISILKKGEKQKKLLNGKFYLNSTISMKLADDKYSTYELLKYYQIPVIEHSVLFNERKIPDVATINQDYNVLKNGKKQVIKANDLLQGKEVYVCDKENEKLQLVQELFAKDIEAVVVCPYWEIEYEYRAIFLDGEVIYVYKKQKPFVIGDGKLTIGELIKQQLKYLGEPNKDLDLTTIPVKGEKITVGWKHNLSNGAIPVLVDEKDAYEQEVKEIATKVGKAMELRFASIDLSILQDKKVYVMEVNSNVCITKFCELIPNGYQIGKNIYAKVIDKIFED